MTVPHILILEDVDSDAELIIYELRRAGIRFVAARATNKEEFLEELERKLPDVILSDYSLPRYTGLEALRLMKGRHLEIQLILVTGSQTEEVAVECMKEGVSDYILKSNLIRLPSAVLNALKRIETEKQKAEAVEALRHTEEQLLLSQKLEAVGRLAGGVAHDFNNLVTAIIGYSQLLLRRASEDDPSRACLEEIKKAGDRAAALTQQLLAFSRKQLMELKVINLNLVVADLETLLRHTVGEDVELKAMLQPGLASVRADSGQIEQVLMNLVINARDAMPMGGKLTVETADVYLDQSYSRQHVEVEPGAYVMLAVSDGGTGMDEETTRHIFEPFFTTKKPGRGTGLGLSTVYGIVKQLGGNIWVYSERGKGTTFKIYFPRVEQPIEEHKKIPEIIDSPRGAETILLVEDAEMVRKLAREILETNGYRVLEAVSGTEALSICKKAQTAVHLLLTDVVMPETSGTSLAQRVQEFYPQLRVLYMSGYTEDAVVHRGILQEGTSFIQKPFTPDGLTQKVRQVLNVPQNRER